MLVPTWSKEALAWKHKHTEDLADDCDQWVLCSRPTRRT
jgi:hypothetical protein